MKLPAKPSWHRRASLDVSHRSPLLCLAFALLTVGLMSCDGGGGGPTAPPPPVPSVAGTWIGTWSLTSITVISSVEEKQLLTFDVTMNLSQTGNHVTGRITFTEDGTMGSGSVEGTVSSAGVLSYRVLAEPTCAAVTGELTLSQDNQRLEGNTVLDSTACTEDRVRGDGPMSLERQ